MSPAEELAGRVARLEANVARIQGDVENLSRIVQTLAPLTAQTAVLVERVGDMDKDMRRIEQLIAEDHKDRRVEARQREQDRKLDRRWLVGTVFSSAALIIAALGLLLGAG